MGLKTEIRRGGVFFKPAEHSTDIALLVEPKSWTHNPNNTYEGRVSPRDEVIADITIFANSDQLNGKAEPTVLKDAIIVSTALASICKENIDEALPVVIRKTKNYWDFEVLSGPTLTKVEKFYDDREAAIAAAMADAPDFDD